MLPGHLLYIQSRHDKQVQVKEPQSNAPHQEKSMTNYHSVKIWLTMNELGIEHSIGTYTRHT